MQINNANIGEFGDRIPTMLEQMTDGKTDANNMSQLPQKAKNYSLPDITCINEPFTVKIMLRYSKKLRSTVIDAEIGERRTLISVRDGFFPIKITALKDGELELNTDSLNEIETVE